MRWVIRGSVSVLLMALLGSACVSDGQPQGDPVKKDLCERYCSTILTCDPDQFDEHFPSLAQCEAACGYAVVGEGGNLSPECTEALVVTVVCVGDLTCPEFHSGGCQAEHAAQSVVCDSP